MSNYVVSAISRCGLFLTLSSSANGEAAAEPVRVELVDRLHLKVGDAVRLEGCTPGNPYGCLCREGEPGECQVLRHIERLVHADGESSSTTARGEASC